MIFVEIKLISTEKPTTVAIIGRVDTVTAPDFQNKLESIIARYPQDLLLDCSELGFLSSAGLRVLFLLARKAKAAHANVTLQSVAPNVREVLKISGFDTFFTVLD